jgi:hypothetical protein
MSGAMLTLAWACVFDFRSWPRKHGHGTLFLQQPEGWLNQPSIQKPEVPAIDFASTSG